MDINEPENDDKSWSLFDSSANSFSSEPLQDNFEEVNLYNDIQDPECDSSYEIIEESLNDGPTNIVAPIIQKNQVEGKESHEEFIENNVHSKARDDFSNVIKSTADNVLNSRPKQEEIKCFENLLRRFDKWFLEKKERKYLRDRGYAQETDFGDSEVPTCKFLVHSQNINAFVFPFSDVYVNIVVNKNSHKHRVQSLFAEFLREVEPQSFTREYDFKSRKNNRKLIFKFSNGNTKFIITVGLDFRVRLNHYIKLCTSIDERFLTMGAFLSYWAYKRNIFNEKYLNPYGLYFMIIYFLMTRSPSILPKFDDDDLQKMHSSKPLFSGRFKSHNQSIIVYKEKMTSTTNTRSNKPSSQAATNEEDPSKVTLGELVMQFFSMFTIEIPNLGRTISVKRGAPIFCGRTIPGYSVEDPFNPQYDLCRNLNDDRCKGYITVKSEFERAYNLILEGKIQELCQERKC